MAEDDWLRDGVALISDEGIGMADPGGCDLHADFIWAELVKLYFTDDEVGFGGGCDGGSSFHAVSSQTCDVTEIPTLVRI